MNIQEARSLQVRGKSVGKFRVRIDGVSRWCYFINDPIGEVIKIDGEHTYLWYRDNRVDQDMTIELLND